MESKEGDKALSFENAMTHSEPKEMTQLSIFDTMGSNQTDDILFELRDINLANVTPIDAMNLVYKWQNQLKERW